MVTLATALARAHAAGSAIVGRNPLVDVEALDAGIWGNRLRISVEDETPGLVTATTLATFVNPTTVRLASAAGVQPGTVLEFYDPPTAPVGDPVKVANVNRQAGSTLTIAGARPRTRTASARNRCAVARVPSHGATAAPARPAHAVARQRR